MNHLKTLEQLFEYTKWTEEKLQDLVNKYETRQEFRKNNKKAFWASNRKGILDELFKNHPNNGYSKTHLDGYWTKERVQEEVDKYETRNEFREKSGSAYNVALKNNLLDDLFKNHTNQGLQVKPNGYWTKDRLQEEVDKYETRNDFLKKSSSAYSVAHQHNLIDELFKNHTNQGYSYREWKEYSYVIYAYELTDFNKVYVGLTNNVKRRDREHLFSEKDRLIGFCIENDIPLPKYKILEENIDARTAQKKEKYWVNYYKEKGWKMFNILKAGGLGGYSKKWTKKRLQEEADKYKTRGEFWGNNSPAANAARKRNLMDELFKNNTNQGHSKTQNKSGYWTKERLQEESDKYKTRNEFAKNSNSAYNSSRRYKLLDELFKNHPNQGYKNKR